MKMSAVGFSIEEGDDLWSVARDLVNDFPTELIAGRPLDASTVLVVAAACLAINESPDFDPGDSVPSEEVKDEVARVLLQYNLTLADEFWPSIAHRWDMKSQWRDDDD